MRTEIQSSSRARRIHQLLLSGLVAVLSALPAAGQLAITEVMSSPSTNSVRVDDFWELTNFGTNDIHLSSYWFRDEGGFTGSANLASLWAATCACADPALIRPGESIIWVRSRPETITAPEEFRQWWGLPSDLKVILYQGYGFSSVADAVQLWQVTENRTNLVQRVEIGESLIGQSITYDPTTGALDRFSAAGVDGAFKAAMSDDVGSPGITIGQVALSVVTPPASMEVDGGSPATLTVRAQGLPVPQYQWRFNGEPIPGATVPTLTIPAATETNAGQHTVELDNGLTNIVTLPATLTVITTNRPAAIVRPPADAEVNPGQTACFSVWTRGFPLPTFQWQFNGVDIPGATASSLCVAEVDGSHAGLYTVHVSNPLGSTNATARLSMVPRPDLIVTEAMANPSMNTSVLGHDSWWELTNVGTNTVKLRGYRWDDNPRSLSGAVVVTNNVVLPPGHSAIFVSSMTPEAFRRWWGEENLPAGLPIITYPGNGLSRWGDSITLWNASAREDDDYLFSIGVLDTNAPPKNGVSLEYDPVFGDLSIPSVLGERCTFRAAESDDVGSPGWTGNEKCAAPRYLSIRREAAGFALRWKTEVGSNYIVQSCSDLGQSDWTTLTNFPAVGPWLSVTNVPATNVGQCFYRVLLQPSGP